MSTFRRFPDEERAVLEDLEDLCQTIRTAAPMAEEVISDRIPS